MHPSRYAKAPCLTQFALSCLVMSAACFGLGCGTSTSPPAPAAKAPDSDSAVIAPPPASVAAPPAPSASIVAVAPIASASASAQAPAAVPAEIPNVNVANIGMHIGGGPNDNVTKEPIRSSVQPHFDAFRRCWGLVADQKKPGDFGVDLTIEREGGRAAVSHPRTALKGEGFTECVVKVFDGIEFKRPKGGKTTVSYSLRFTPDR